jgi:multicomponent Na+:H+ antiporter subunit F
MLLVGALMIRAAHWRAESRGTHHRTDCPERREEFHVHDLWHRLAALASLSTKVALVMLVVAVVRGDPMPALVSVLILSVGNAGILLIANLLRQREEAGP